MIRLLIQFFFFYFVMFLLSLIYSFGMCIFLYVYLCMEIAYYWLCNHCFIHIFVGNYCFVIDGSNTIFFARHNSHVCYMSQSSIICFYINRIVSQVHFIISYLGSRGMINPIDTLNKNLNKFSSSFFLLQIFQIKIFIHQIFSE